jgi:hypothetical protein
MDNSINYENSIIISDKFIFNYNGAQYIGKIINYSCTYFIVVNTTMFERLLFEFKMNTDGHYIGIVSINNTHELIDDSLNIVLYNNSIEHQNYLLSNEKNIIDTNNTQSSNDFFVILNFFTKKYLNIIPADDILLNLMYFFLTGYNRTYILCMCALNNDMTNFNIILNNIKVDYTELLYVLQHTFGYLTLKQYEPTPKYLSHIVSKKIYMQHIQNMAYLRYIYPHLRNTDKIFEQIRQLI